MNAHFVFPVVIMVAWLFPGFCSAEDSFVCPELVRISSGSVVLDSVPSGYEAIISKAPIRLSGINVFDGPPEQGAALMPYSEKSNSKKLETMSVWKFEGNYPQGKFISCDYAKGLVRVVAQTNDSVISCTAKTEVVKPHNTMKAYFVCE
jgi:hypothetical protein